MKWHWIGIEMWRDLIRKKKTGLIIKELSWLKDVTWTLTAEIGASFQNMVSSIIEHSKLFGFAIIFFTLEFFIFNNVFPNCIFIWEFSLIFLQNVFLSLP